MTSQVWMPIPSTNGFYEASNFGEIRSVDRLIAKKNGRVEWRKGKVLSQITEKDGYKVVCICLSGKYFTKKVHRLVAEAFLFKPEGKNIVNHKDGNKSNNSYLNLEWVTSKENTLHSVSTGLHCQGVAHKNSKPVYCASTGRKFISIKQASEVLKIKHSTLKNDVQTKRNKYLIPEEQGDYIINYPQYEGEWTN